MQILPVLDLLNGLVVRGVAGNRAEYRPVESRLTDDPTPLAVARALRGEFGLCDFYLADLDAIQFGNPNWETYRQLSSEGFRLWIDAGVQDLNLPSQILSAGAAGVIVGLESCSQPELLREIVEAYGRDRIIFSLDLKQGVPLGNLTAWGSADPLEIARQAVAAGVVMLIVLDLAQVGARAGLSTPELCLRIKQEHSALRIITGGGVRGADDLARLQALGIDGVLVATALHDGSLTAAEVAQFTL